MTGLVGFWSYGLAAAAFAAVMIWRIIGPNRHAGQRLMLAALAMTACWAWLTGVDPDGGLARYAETARNLIWIAFLYALSSASDERQRGVRLVYSAVAAALGLQLVFTFVVLSGDTGVALATSWLLRITAAAGALVLVHNFYAQSAPVTRTQLRFTMVGLAAMWLYDLNYFTIQYLSSDGAERLGDWRGILMLLTAPLFALGAHEDKGLRVKLSRTASFQSLSILAICGYFAMMVILSTALRDSSSDWFTNATVAVLAVMTVGAMVVIPSGRARGWLKVKIAQHLFEHRYDYRSEWLRFTATIGRSNERGGPLSDRIIMAFADILDSPGGLLLTSDGGEPSISASWNWPGTLPSAMVDSDGSRFWSALQASGRVLELEAIRGGWAHKKDSSVPVPDWMMEEADAWSAVPLIHENRLIGVVLLAAPDYRRPLDWEDFDLLRTAGRQAASSLADAHSQEALATAQRFEEFNRRFAFILHDIKNLVSQLSLVARNAERHADNPEFRADMVATLRSSVNKMNDLLARLAPHGPPRVHDVEAQPLRPIISDVIAATRGERDVQLSGDAGAWAQVDASALEHALRNLIQNAIEASPLVEPVTVRVSRKGTQIAIAVSDKGCGMDSDFIRNRLFLPFASTKPDGFGIGAFEARSLVAAMGGRLTVDSRPDHGTTFTIILPAAEPIRSAERKRA